MTTEEDGPLQHDPDISAAQVAGGGGSVLDRIKRRRTDQSDVLWLDIPSWGGELKARYQVLDRDEVEKMIRRVQARQRQGDKSRSDSTPDLDFLIKACTEVKAVDSETDEEETLTPGFTLELVDMLDPKDEDGSPIAIKDQRSLVAYLVKYNGIALAAHAQKVARWMQDTSKSVEDPQ